MRELKSFIATFLLLHVPLAFLFSISPLDLCIRNDTLTPVESERPLDVVFFATAAGNEPVREWLKSLPKEERHSIGEDILTVQYAWPVGKPLVDSLGDGLWEVRSRLKNRIARVIFIVANEDIVLLHGFIKKGQKTPAPDLALARKRKKEYLQS